MQETNVIRSHVYGNNPRDLYAIEYGGKTVCIETPSLSALTDALGDDYIPQDILADTIDNLASAGKMEFTDEEKLTFAKEQVKKAINTNDSMQGADCVNNFYFEYGGQKFPYWFNAYERTALTSEATLWAKKYGSYRIDARKYGVSFEISCDTLLDWLGRLKDYAIKCYNKTTDHLIAVSALTTVEDVAAYDYKAGYPDNLVFKIE